MVGFVDREAESADEAMVKKMRFLYALPSAFVWWYREISPMITCKTMLLRCWLVFSTR
jgi:hypothetical protein